METESSKSRKLDIFPKGLTHGFGSKMAIFPNFFFGNIGKENVFYDILQRKNPFLGYKNKSLKKSKHWHFSNGVNPWFWSKNGHCFQLFFLGNIGKENVFYNIQERKNSFLRYKNKKLKKSKSWHFSKEVNPSFWSKNCHISTFFFGNIGQQNVFFDILERKHAFLGFKKNTFKKSKNSHFFKGVNPWFWSKSGHFSNFFFYAMNATKMSFRIFKNEKTPF